MDQAAAAASSSSSLFQQYKNRGHTQDEFRRRREEEGVQLRKLRRDEALSKRRHAASLPDDSSTAMGITSAIAAQTTENLLSAEQGLQLDAAVTIRQLLSNDAEPNSPLLDELVEADGVLDRVVELLANSADNPLLQLECAWVLTNIASGTTAHTMAVVRAGAVEVLFRVLATSADDNLREQALWALGNVAGDSAPLRDLCLEAGLMQHIVDLLSSPPSYASPQMSRTAVWVASNLCRGNSPPPIFALASQGISVLCARLLCCDSEDVEQLADACWALAQLSHHRPNEQIQAMVDTGVTKRLVELLTSRNYNLLNAALRVVGNFVAGNDEQTQAVVSNGGVECLHDLLNHSVDTIRKEALWAISNITAGSKKQIEAVISGDIEKIVAMMSKEEFKIRKEAVWCVANALNGGSVDQVRRIVAAGAIEPLCDLLTIMDSSVVSVALDALHNVLRCGAVHSNKGVCRLNPYAQRMEECGGLAKLEYLMQSESTVICVNACELHDRYFDDECDRAESIADDEYDGDGIATTQHHFQPVHISAQPFRF